METVHVSVRGLCGDRAYACRRHRPGKSRQRQKRQAVRRTLEVPGAFCQPPGSRAISTGPHHVSGWFRSPQRDDPDAGPILTQAFGPDISLTSNAPDGLMLEFAAGTLGGKHASTTELPVSSGAPKGTLFNYAAVHIVTTSTLRHLGQATAERFRPNIVVEGPEDPAFPGKRLDWSHHRHWSRTGVAHIDPMSPLCHNDAPADGSSARFDGPPYHCRTEYAQSRRFRRSAMCRHLRRRRDTRFGVPG